MLTPLLLLHSTKLAIRPSIIHSTQNNIKAVALIFTRWLAAVTTTGTSAIVYSQCASIQLLAVEGLLCSDSTLDILEVSVCESPWLSGTSVNGNTNINDILDVTEKLVEVGIGHLEWDVTEEESLARFCV